MIPRANITAWRAHAPWASDAQVEQDLVITRALVEIYRDPHLGAALAFRGGTALHKLFFQPAARYSEDLDFVQVRNEPIGPVMTALRAILDRWLGKAQYKQSEGRVTVVYRFESEGVQATRMRLKVEINTREHFTVLGYRRERVAVANPWFTGEAEVVTFALEELLGTKLRALYQRKKGRDAFDLARSIETHPSLDRAKIVECFSAYMKHGGTPVIVEALADKYIEHQPIERQCTHWSRAGVDIAPQTLGRSVGAAIDMLEPVAALIEEQTRAPGLLGTDATGIPVLDPTSPEGIRTGSMWCWTNARWVTFFYAPSADSDSVRRFLGDDLARTMQCDGTNVTTFLERAGGKRFLLAAGSRCTASR